MLQLNTAEKMAAQSNKGEPSSPEEGYKLLTPDPRKKGDSWAKQVKGTFFEVIKQKENGTNQANGTGKKHLSGSASINKITNSLKRVNVQSHNSPVQFDLQFDRFGLDESNPNISEARYECMEKNSKTITTKIHELSAGGVPQPMLRQEPGVQAGAKLQNRTSYFNPLYFPEMAKNPIDNESTNLPDAGRPASETLVERFRASNNYFSDQMNTRQAEAQQSGLQHHSSSQMVTPVRQQANCSAQKSVDLSAYSIERIKELENKMIEAERAKEESLRRVEDAFKQLKQAEYIIEEKEKQIKKQEMFLEDIKNHKEEAENSKLKHISLTQKLQEEQESLANLLKLKENFLASLKEQLEKSEMQRMRTLAQLQEIRGKLRIYCRLKPIPELEERAVQMKDKDQKEVVLNLDQSKKAKPQLYFFDHVFSEQANQVDVYSEIDPFVQGTLDGNSVCIIAYGPTGSGKTHTLEGSNPDLDTVCELSGILPRSLFAIIQHIQKRNNVEENAQEHLEIFLACLELYNDRLGDLLAKCPKNLKDPSEDEVSIGTDKTGKVILQGLTKVKINSMREALDIIRQSNERRQTESTAFNSKSSRSHTIYRITISKVRQPEMALGLLNIVDLAGSEKNSMAHESNQQSSGNVSREASLGPNQGNSSKRASFAVQVKQQTSHQEKLKKIQNEANHINKSLTSLGRILRLIREQRSTGLKDRAIPYRESKLTRLLQDCIGGDAQTLLIINLNPGAKHCGQTKEALLFSSSASV